MKRTFFVLGSLILVISILPFVFAEDATGDIGIAINVSDVDSTTCVDPVIYKDHTARIWEPNDQTIYTASEYGTGVTNKHGYSGWEVPLRQNYVFRGETLKYFVIVQDGNGVDDIVDLRLQLNQSFGGSNVVEIGQCAPVSAFTDLSAFINDQGDFLTSYDSATMKSYVCTVIVQAGWYGLNEIGFVARDGGSTACAANPNVINSTQSDWLYFNPNLAVTLTGPIQFGAVSPSSTAMSNTIYVQNAADPGSGVMMDMYISSDDYFTDPSNPTAICGEGNGIKYDQFSYYATKGSINSGANDNLYPGLGETATGLCEANVDEFTPLPSHSGHIEDMCRIINHIDEGSVLAEGADMSMTFKLDVPTPCQGFFTNGQFHIVGRVI